MKKGSILPATIYYKGVPMLFVQALISSYKAMNNLMPLQAETSAILNNARTKNGEAFLKSEAEWIFLVDTDMWWEPSAIIRLMKTAREKKAKAVAGLAFMEQKGRVIPNAYAFIPDSIDGKGKVLAPYALLPTLDQPFTVDATGGSCFLVHRDVYSSLKAMMKGKTRFYWQEDVYLPNADDMQGEDITFSKRIRAAGYDIWYEPRALFSHLSKETLLDVREYLAYVEVLKDNADI